MSDPFDFILGQRAAQKGKPCPKGASGMFVRGYGFEYGLQEINSKQAEAGYGREKTKRAAQTVTG